MTDLRTNPTVSKLYTNRALEDIREEYPGIHRSMGDTPAEIRQGSVRGPGFSEANLDDPDKFSIEMRKARRNFFPREATKYDTEGGREISRDMLAGEFLHKLGSMDGQQPFDREFYALKESLIDSLDTDQIEYLEKMYNRHKRDGATGTNWESFENALATSLGDGLIRDRLFPETGLYEEDRVYLRRGGGFSPDQMKIIDQIRNLISE